METNTPQSQPTGQAPVSTQPVLTKDMKQANRERERRNRKLKDTLTWLIPAVLVLGGVFWLVMSGGSGSVDGDVNTSALPVAEDRIYGKIDAKVKLVEYGDFQCPACAAYWPAVVQLKQQYPNDLVVAFRHFPLTQIHMLAASAAVATEAANLQGKFWEMHDKIYENQKIWTVAADPNAEFQKYASEIGLDVGKYTADFENADAYQDLIISHMKSGGALKVTGTPTFFLNGQKVSVQSPQQLLDLVAAAVNDGAAPQQ